MFPQLWSHSCSVPDPGAGQRPWERWVQPGEPWLCPSPAPLVPAMLFPGPSSSSGNAQLLKSLRNPPQAWTTQHPNPANPPSAPLTARIQRHCCLLKTTVTVSILVPAQCMDGLLPALLAPTSAQANQLPGLGLSAAAFATILPSPCGCWIPTPSCQTNPEENMFDCIKVQTSTCLCPRAEAL